MDPELTTLKRLFGGEVASDVWAYPDAKATIEESLQIIPKKGLCFHVSRARIKAKFNGEFSKKGLLLLECSATVMKPNTAGVKKVYVKKMEPAAIQTLIDSLTAS